MRPERSFYARRKMQDARAILVKHQRGLCYYCKRRMEPAGSGCDREATLDHMVPVSLGGARGRANFVAACKTCNIAKGSLTAEEFFDVLREFNQEEVDDRRA